MYCTYTALLKLTQYEHEHDKDPQDDGEKEDEASPGRETPGPVTPAGPALLAQSGHHDAEEIESENEGADVDGEEEAVEGGQLPVLDQIVDLKLLA